jgi:hypothetical protein
LRLLPLQHLRLRATSTAQSQVCQPFQSTLQLLLVGGPNLGGRSRFLGHAECISRKLIFYAVLPCVVLSTHTAIGSNPTWHCPENQDEPPKPLCSRQAGLPTMLFLNVDQGNIAGRLLHIDRRPVYGIKLGFLGTHSFATIKLSVAHGSVTGDSTAHIPVSSATPEDLLPVKASPDESGGQGLDARPTAAKHTGDVEAESPLVAFRIAVSDGENVPASHTSSNKSKTGVHSLQFACNAARPCKVCRSVH